MLNEGFQEITAVVLAMPVAELYAVRWLNQDILRSIIGQNNLRRIVNAGP